MSFKSIIVLAIITGLAGALPHASAEVSPNRFKAEHVFELEYANDPQISPDGGTIVYVRQSMDLATDRIRGDLWVIDTANGEHRPLVTGGASATSPRWSPDGSKLLYTTSKGGKPDLRILFMDTGDSFALTQLNGAPRQATWAPDGKTIAFTLFTKSKQPSFAKEPDLPRNKDWNPPVRVFDDIRFRSDGRGYLKEGADHVYTVSASGGSIRRVTDGEADFGSPTWLDADTLLVVGNDAEDRDLDPIESEIYVVELSTRSRRALTDRDGPDSSPAVSPNGAKIAYTGFDDKVLSWQQNRLYLMNADGSGKREIKTGLDREIQNVQWGSDGQSLYAQVPRDGEVDLVEIALDGSTRTLLTGLGGTSIGRPYAGGTFSVSKTRAPQFAYTAGFNDRPAEVATSDKNGNTRILTELNADLLPHLDMAPLEEIKVKSSVDGREIEAWVALPPGFKANGGAPMIIEIHGGPFAMYGPFFAAEIQRFAAEGYVTVYVNPRGSTGYGEEFAQLIDLAYPGDDYHDLMDVVTALVDKNYVSEDRLFVTGGSGGGILTAWIVGQTDRFAAAASIKPVINWMTMALASDIAALVKRHWIRADPWSDPDAYLSRSPITLIDNVTTPTLMMVGEEDYRTPAWEAEQFYTALKLKGVDTALIRIPDAPHLIAGRPSRLIAKTDNILGWFKKYDPANQ